MGGRKSKAKKAVFVSVPFVVKRLENYSLKALSMCVCVCVRETDTVLQPVLQSMLCATSTSQLLRRATAV